MGLARVVGEVKEKKMGDVVRKKYRELTDDEQRALAVMKDTAAALYSRLEEAEAFVQADKRCLALANTKLEESVMWATKGITG